MEVPALPRFIVDDATPERLVGLMAAQGGRIAALSPEGDTLESLVGRYSDTVNLSAVLKAHAGDNIRVDRIGRASEYIERAALTLGLTVQPAFLQGIATKPGFRGRGLLARFLYSWPQSPLGHRDVDAPPVPEAIRAAYQRGVLALLELPFGTDEDGEPAAHVLRLDAEAKQLLRDFMLWIEPQLGAFGEMATMTDWGGKLAGAVVRIAGLLHMAAHCNAPAPWQYPIEAATFKAAIRLGHYLLAHAKATFGEMGADQRIAAAQHVLRWIERSGSDSFTKQEVWQGTRGHFKTVDAMEPALRLLEQYNYIREREAPQRQGPGRNPAPSYEVNPLWLGNSRDCRNCRDGGAILGNLST